MFNDEKIYTFVQAKKVMLECIQRMDVHAKPPVYRMEIKIRPVDLIDWLALQDSIDKVYGADQDNTYAIAGIGEALTFKGSKTGNVSGVFRTLRQYLTPQYPYMQWYGGFCFDDAHQDAEWKEFGAYRFILPRFELASDGKRMIFCCNLIGTLDEAVRDVILKELEGVVVQGGLASGRLKSTSRQDFSSRPQWEASAKRVLEWIETGSLAKAVLARKTILKFPAPLNPFVLLKRLQQVTPRSYHFCFQFRDTSFLGASPERLFKRRGRMLVSEAIAGTRERGATAGQDARFKKGLVRSEKDNHEHQLVVDAIRDGLKPLCVRLGHKGKPSVISLGNGHHLRTPFEGELKDQVSDEDILKALHPTPAVAGSPKLKSLGVIRGLEPFSRGWYAGPVGYVGLDWAEFVVGIRSGVIKGKELSIYAGAGIVRGSDPKLEWLEVENKISNFIKVVK